MPLDVPSQVHFGRIRLCALWTTGKAEAGGQGFLPGKGGAAYTPGPELCYSRSPLKDRKIHKENNILIGSKELKNGLKRNQLLSQNLATANMRKTCKLHLGKFYTDKVLFRNSSTLPVFQVVGIISTNPHVREFFLVIRRGRQDSPFETKIWPSREKHERSKCIIKK